MLRVNIEASQLVTTLRTGGTELADELAATKRSLDVAAGHTAYLRTWEGRLNGLCAVALRMSHLMNPHQLFDAVWDHVAVLVGAEATCIFMIDGETREASTLVPIIAGSGIIAAVRDHWSTSDCLSFLLIGH